MIYSTENFYFSCALIALNVKLVNVVDSLKNKKAFYFAIDEKEAKKLLDRFYEKDLMVDAKTFVEAIKQLKDRIYD